MSWFGLQTVIAGLVVFLLIWHRIRSPNNLPPGPWGWPYLGYLPNLFIQMRRTGLEPPMLLDRLAKKYGDIYSMRIGGKVVIVLNEYNVIKEAFQNPMLLDRPHSAATRANRSDKGVLFANGELWKRLRKFTLATLRNFGVGKRSFEDDITKETKALLDEISLLAEESFNPHHLLENATANVISSVVLGRRYDYSDPHFQGQLKGISKRMNRAGSGGIRICFPFLRFFIKNFKADFKASRDAITTFLTDIIREHKIKLDKDNPNDFIDVFLCEMPDSDEEILLKTIQHLFFAGADTTATTLRWGLLYMAIFPQIQEQVQEELDLQVGQDRLPQMADVPKLPYTQATLLEIQRFATIGPLAVPHCAAEDTRIGQYDVPKGSLIVANIWAVHHNPVVWPQPNEFKPERFLKSTEQQTKQPQMIPFSIGRRMCLGENLAKMELFLFFTHLLHKFSFKSPRDSPPLSVKGVTGLGYTPKPFQIVAVPRK